jgi:multiple sugar transport system permease protein
MSMEAASPFSATFRRHPRVKALVHLALVMASLLLVFPALWMLMTSFKPIGETMSYPPHLLPHDPAWGNYGETLAYIPFWTYTKNTLVAASLAAAGTTLSSALVAYGFVRIDWPGKNAMFALTLGTMMVPFPVLMVPLYAVFRTLGWIGTLSPLWAPSLFGGAFNIFLLRQFFMRIPKSLAEAMMLDGASELEIFRRVYLPLSAAPLAVVAFFQFVFTWNDFLGPLLFLTDQDTFTLSLGLQFYQSQLAGTEWHYLMAASVLTTLPIMVLFFFLQKRFLQGLGFLKSVEG